MAHSQFTANVWGQGKVALNLSRLQGTLKDDEEECHICRDDRPVGVGFKPCGHGVCFHCVESMRAKNIFRGDQGVKCPFCRAYVDEYVSLVG